MLGKGYIFKLSQLDIKLVLVFFTYSKTVSAEVAATRDSCPEGVLVEVVGIEDVKLCVYLL